jgi:hypothetical protein
MAVGCRANISVRANLRIVTYFKIKSTLREEEVQIKLYHYLRAAVHGLYRAAADEVGCICHVRLVDNYIMTHRQVLANCNGHQNCFNNSAAVFDIGVKYGILFLGLLDIRR